MKMVDIFFKEIIDIDGYGIYRKENSARLIPPKSKYYFMPNIFIKDLERLEKVLMNYLIAVKSTNIRSTKMDNKHDIRYFLGTLIKNLSNYDSSHFEEYVENYTQFILDDTFTHFDKKTCLGSLDENYTINVRRTEEYYGPETPYVFKIYKKNNHIEYELPLIRYGIYINNYGNKVARIYMIQRKKIYAENEMVKEVNKSFSSINSGSKDYRDVSPSMVASLTIFIGLLHSEGIFDIEVVDYIPRRFAHFQGVNTEKEREFIQERATNKFLKLFLRVSTHIEGFDVTYLPNEIDSFLHAKLNKNLLCKSPNLEPYLLLGMNKKKEEDFNLKLDVLSKCKTENNKSI